MFLLDGFEQLESVKLAALQPDIEEDKVRPPRDDRAQRIIAVTRSARDVAFVLQDTRNQIADIGLVVDNQNFRGHVTSRLQMLVVLTESAPLCQQQKIVCVPRHHAGRISFRWRHATRCCRRVPR